MPKGPDYVSLKGLIVQKKGCQGAGGSKNSVSVVVFVDGRRVIFSIFFTGVSQGNSLGELLGVSLGLGAH